MKTHARARNHGRSKTARMLSPRLGRRISWTPGASVPVLDERIDQLDLGAVGGADDLDRPWRRAQAFDDAVDDGDVLADDLDAVDELGHALGVERDDDAEVWTSAEILEARDRGYWRLERRAADLDGP